MHYKLLSVLQPWAFLLAHGFKDVENRTWPTHFRGEFLIHAGKRWGPEQRQDLASIRRHFPGISLPEKFDLGGIVGRCDLIDCVHTSDSPWFNGPYGFVVAKAESIPFIPCMGALGFFNLPAGIAVPERVKYNAGIVMPELVGHVERSPDSVGLGTNE